MWKCQNSLFRMEYEFLLFFVELNFSIRKKYYGGTSLVPAIMAVHDWLTCGNSILPTDDFQ